MYKIGILNILLALILASACQEHHIVQTSVGKIRGFVEKYRNVDVFQFRGIPYAKPPVGDLRFRKPVPYGSWNYVLDATKERAACMQDNEFFNLTTNVPLSEDCLFLNIHVPRDVSTSNSKSVMVWIHGGGFSLGQGSWYDGSYLAGKGDVIVVTFNYRLGIFGFLTTMDSAAPGNFALWDQRLAIEWVKSNIASFGGNPSSITIFGQSAGGFSAMYQSIIPYNKGLFQRVIAQSGVSNSLPLISNPERLNRILAKQLDCDDVLKNSYSFVDCLRTKSSEQILKISASYGWPRSWDRNFEIVIAPSLDNDLFKFDPKVILADKTSSAHSLFKSLDYMAGCTDGEGSFMPLMMSVWSDPIDINDGISRHVFCDVLSPIIVGSFLNKSAGLIEAFCDKYKVKGNETKQLAKQAIETANMFGDIFLVGPSTKSLLVHARENVERKSFQYLFTRPMSLIPIPSWFKQAGHANDLLYLFGADKVATMFNITLTDEDFILEDRMLRYWTNFAKYGDPNGDSLPKWPEFGQEENYIQLDHEIKSSKKLYPERMEFYLEEIPKILDKESSRSHNEL